MTAFFWYATAWKQPQCLFVVPCFDWSDAFTYLLTVVGKYAHWQEVAVPGPKGPVSKNFFYKHLVVHANKKYFVGIDRSRLVKSWF